MGVVWKSSTKLGCGKGTATVGGNTGDFWVCQYGPSGNIGGLFTTEVLAPSVAVTLCGGTSADLPTGGTSPVGGLGVSGQLKGIVDKKIQEQNVHNEAITNRERLEPPTPDQAPGSSET